MESGRAWRSGDGGHQFHGGVVERFGFGGVFFVKFFEVAGAVEVAELGFKEAVHGGLGGGFGGGGALAGFFQQGEEGHDEDGAVAVEVFALVGVVEFEEFDGDEGAVATVSAGGDGAGREAAELDDVLRVFIKVADGVEEVGFLGGEVCGVVPVEVVGAGDGEVVPFQRGISGLAGGGVVEGMIGQ